MTRTVEDILSNKKRSMDDILNQPDITIPDPADPNETEKIKDIINIAIDIEAPIETVENNYKNLTDRPRKLISGTIMPPGLAKGGEPEKISAAPERTKWQKFKKFFVGERPPLPPDADRIEKVSRAYDIAVSLPLRTFLKASKGMMLNTPDLMWAAIKRITPDDMWDDEVKNMTLDEAMDWAGSYNPSGFQKSVGEIAEFAGRLKTVAPIAEGLGIIGRAPSGASALDKALETALLFGSAAVPEQIAKGASEIIDPSEAEYGFEGPKAVLRDMALGAIFSLVSQGAKGLWSKLTPNEHQKALELLGLKEGATQEEITKAANALARQYHPDKAKGFVEEFKQVIKARDTLRQGEVKDIVFRGQKVTLKSKLLPGETTATGAITKPVAGQMAKTSSIEAGKAAAEQRAGQITVSETKTPQKAKQAPEIEAEKPIVVQDILGGVDPLQRIHDSLKQAEKLQPLIEAEKKAAIKKRVGSAAGAMKSNIKKGTPTEEAIFKSTGLLKGPLAEYDQRYTSIENVLEPDVKEAAYQQIYKHPELRYFEIVNTATSFKKLLAGTALTPGDVKNIERVFGKQFKDITEVRQTKSDLYDRLVTLWKAGLLTGIKTSGLNTLANVSHAQTETAKDIPAVLVDSIASLITGERTIGLTVRGVPSGTIEGIEKGWKYLRTGVDARNIGQKLDYKEVYFGNSKFAKALQAYEETIFHLLGAEDQPFYYGAKARSLYSQAIAQAKNKGLKGAQRKTFIENLVKNPTDDMLEWSVYDAEIAVFQNRTHLGDIAKSIQKVKGGEVIVPFGRTPAAVATQIINYSPVGIVEEIAKEIKNKKFDQRKFSQAFGRATIGTGALFIGTLLFKTGMMTLDRPNNERERELWKLEGRSANSIKIGDKWRTVQTLGPIGNVLIIGGHFQKMLDEEGSPTKAIVTALAGGAKSFSEQTFVRGVNQAVDALTDPERSFENWFSSMSGSLVPTIVADTARAMDEQERRAIGPKERVQKRIPILREKLEPQIDVFGQDLPRYGGNVLETMADPTRPSKIRQDVVVDELRRLWDKNIKVSPTQLGDKKGYEILTDEENTQLWRRSGELTYKLLLALINNEAYQNTDDFQKGKAVEVMTRKAKEAAKAEIVNIKLNQGKTIMELAESGLLTIDSLEMLKYYRENQ